MQLNGRLNTETKRLLEDMDDCHGDDMQLAIVIFTHDGFYTASLRNCTKTPTHLLVILKMVKVFGGSLIKKKVLIPLDDMLKEYQLTMSKKSSDHQFNKSVFKTVCI
ncbi:hypothetical protein PX669_19560 (plasmid) [Acinetobacter soli]|nr:hypothetical protein PX669_19560 [Acinetobacter soli]